MAEELQFDSQQGQEIFLFTIVFRPALRPAQPPIQQLLGALSLGVKLQVHESDHSPPSSAAVKNGGAIYLHSPIHLHGMVLN
jgi:hypothetical protein